MAVQSPASIEAVERMLVSRPGGLYRLVRFAWPYIEAVPFVEGWHLEEVCAHLEAISRGELDRLIINIPPGCSKSLSVSVVWPVWDWIQNPWRKFMFASFDAALSQRDALRAKDLIKSRWFQERWGVLANPFELKDEGRKPLAIIEKGKQSTASVYWSTGGGLRFSTSVGGRSTGWHGHIQVVDDPTKPQDLQGGGKKARGVLQRTDHWWNQTMSTRRADPQHFARVIMMQRLHELDLAGVAERSGDYTMLRLPMRFETKNKCVTSFGGDRRTKEGELLCPERFSEDVVKQGEKDLGPQGASAQFQQRPSPEGGTIFKRSWFNHRYTGVPVAARFIQSWDCTFDDTADADFVSGGLWAEYRGKFYRLDEVHARMDFIATIQAIKDWKHKWPQARTIVIEKKANGPAVIKTLKQTMSGVVAWDPGTQSKEGRAVAVSGYFEAGDVLLPENALWVPEYVQEMSDFPRGANDDRVDETTQAILYYTDRGKTRLGEAMSNV